MSIAELMGRIAETSPRLKARIAGVFYLLTIVMGAAALAVHGRLGFAVDLIATVCYLGVTALFYDLFKPVNKSISQLAAFFLLMECAVLAFASLFQVAPMLVLGGAGYLSVFKTAELQALALLFLNLNTQVFNISLMFFGYFCLLIGYLIFRSTFLPSILGILYALAGLGYLTYLVPPLADYLYPFNLVPAAFGEPALILWLLIVGVNVQRWKQQANAAREAVLHV